MGGFAVLDVETTGLHPGYHHRVTEIAVVLLDEKMRVVGRYESLINPERDMGAQEIHAIAARDARLAPKFEAIAGDVRAILAGRVLVAHNALFDLTFLDAEFERAGFPLPRLWEASLCTMLLSDYYLDGHVRTLGGCCEAVGLDYQDAHRAAADADAAARLLAIYYDAEPDAEWWPTALWEADSVRWPEIAQRGTPPVVRGVGSDGVGAMEKLIQRLERFVEPPYSPQYFALLDRVLADGKLTLTERRELEAFSSNHGLTDEEVGGLNRSYMAAAVRAFTEDQYLTQYERARIIQFSELLQLPQEDGLALLELATRQAFAVETAVLLRPGDEIVLTGLSDEQKADLGQVAAELGLRVHPRVTRATRLVIALDLDSASGKASRARVTGVPVVDVDAFTTSISRLRAAGSTGGIYTGVTTE